MIFKKNWAIRKTLKNKQTNNFQKFKKLQNK